METEVPGSSVLLRVNPRRHCCSSPATSCRLDAMHRVRCGPGMEVTDDDGCEKPYAILYLPLQYPLPVRKRERYSNRRHQYNEKPIVVGSFELTQKSFIADVVIDE